MKYWFAINCTIRLLLAAYIPKLTVTEFVTPYTFQNKYMKWYTETKFFTWFCGIYTDRLLWPDK